MIFDQTFVMIPTDYCREEFHNKASLKTKNVCGNCHSCKSQMRELHMNNFILLFAVHCRSQSNVITVTRDSCSE